jgi:hypothetical protein
MNTVCIGSPLCLEALSHGHPSLLPGITNDPSLNRGWVELKSHPASVSSGVIAAPPDVSQETAAIHPFYSERLLSAQIASEPKAASFLGSVLHQHLVGKNRSVLVTSANGDRDSQADSFGAAATSDSVCF